MSTIKATSNEAVYKIEKFLGLNENPDGDVKLKLGEASVCRNWRVTRDRNLQRRPGFHTKINLGTSAPVTGLWYGNINGSEIGLAASGGHMWKFYEDGYLDEVKDLGQLETSGFVNFFAYNNIVYILNGEEYYSYDGVKFGIVKGYRPLVATSLTPAGAEGTLLEEVNKLNGMRRVWYSPDGTSTTFQLPESDLLSVDYVKINQTGKFMNPSLYSFNRFDGTVTFTTAPERGVDTIEIGYSAPSTYRNDVCKMTNAELFLGAQDNAVFLYGNGTNEAVYSGLDYNGIPRADYFPDLNEMAVADNNTPITGMVRHYSQLICFKTNSAYSVQFGMIYDADSNAHWGFYVKPINKQIGNTALGQVRLVLNSPFTLHGKDLYEWHNTSSYSSNLSVDERQAKRASDRIFSTLGSFDFNKCYCYDDNDNQEYYIWCGAKALVYNYAADAWYTYTGPSVKSMCNIEDDVLFGTEVGTICELAEEYLNDDGVAVDSYWESGSIDFGKAYMRKMMTEVWVGIKPQERSFVTVTVMTNKKPDYTEKDVVSNLSTFWHMNFADFSFLVNRKPQVKKLKIKAKKFAFLKFVLKSKDLYNTATVLLIDPKIRETGYMK